METQKKISQYDYKNKGKIFEPYIRESDYRLKTDEYIVIHLDGVGFTSKYYKNISNNARKIIVNALMQVAKELSEKINSVRVSYVCSDEISLILDGHDIDSNFHNRINKIISTISSRTTLLFYKKLIEENNNEFDVISDNCIFAAKAYNIPNDYVKEYLDWRLLGCKKLIFDKRQDYNKKENWEKFGFIITKNDNGIWEGQAIDFTDKRVIKEPQNEFFQIKNKEA